MDVLAEARATSPTDKRPAWKALEAHYQQVRKLHLRKLFADDPGRGERLTAEAVGVYLDYSKNRITGETVKLLVQLAEQSGLRPRIDAMFGARKSTSRRTAPSCTSPCALPKAHRSW
jgi:glucose-6-phosphate isomerase